MIQVTQEKKFLIDEEGQKIGVLLGMNEYTRILEELEELESIREYDIAKNSDQEFVPLEDAFLEIEKKDS